MEIMKEVGLRIVTLMERNKPSCALWQCMASQHYEEKTEQVGHDNEEDKFIIYPKRGKYNMYLDTNSYAVTAPYIFRGCNEIRMTEENIVIGCDATVKVFERRKHKNPRRNMCFVLYISFSCYFICFESRMF